MRVADERKQRKKGKKETTEKKASNKMKTGRMPRGIMHRRRRKRTGEEKGRASMERKREEGNEGNKTNTDEASEREGIYF